MDEGVFAAVTTTCVVYCFQLNHLVCKLLLCFLSACINVALDALERDEAYEKGEVAFCSFRWFIILPIVVEFTTDACCLGAIQYDCTAICQRSGNGLKLYWQLF